jgi:hypothetical protein
MYSSFECVIHEPHPRSQVEKSSKALGILINLIKECFPRDQGWGWNLPKMHAFAKMPHNMLKFGSANNISGNIGERALKGIVKDHAEKTQRRPDEFAEQCAIHEYESNVIKYVMTDISSQIGLSTHSS